MESFKVPKLPPVGKAKLPRVAVSEQLTSSVQLQQTLEQSDNQVSPEIAPPASSNGDSTICPPQPSPPPPPEEGLGPVEQHNTAVGAEDSLRLPYTEPSWSGPPPQPHHLCVIKNGVELDAISLSDKPYCVVGRLPSCHMRLEHPSISRYHAVIQYRPIAESPSEQQQQQHVMYSNHPKDPGYYLYDLHSTHGTFLNKNKVQPRVYYRLRVGQTIRFGGSTRLFVLEQDEGNLQEVVQAEAESEREELQRLKNEREELIARAEAERLRREKEEEEMGATWGMVMDDVSDGKEGEGEEVELDPQREAYYINDPKKALRKFFEREGLELEYETEESVQQRNKVYTVRVSLPIDTTTGELVYAEGSGRGKKEAVLECALTACRMLDADGILRESRKTHRTQLRNWEENDYYDSDEDNFLDRTGDVDRKRRRRMKKAGRASDTVETYESLQAKLSEVEKELASLQQQVSRLSGRDGEDDGEGGGDSLDVFMKSVGRRAEHGKIADIKQRMHQLRKEQQQLDRLVKVARPYQLPEMSDSKDDQTHSPHLTSDTPTTITSSTITSPTTSTITSQTTTTSTINSQTTTNQSTAPPANNSSTSSHTDTHLQDPAAADESRAQRKRRRKHLYGPTMPPPQSAPATTSNKGASYEGEGTLDYSSWLPPENQSGDGRTSLNEKFGY